MKSAFNAIDSINSNSILGFQNFRFCDPVELLEKYDVIFPGSFNPVHNAHLAVGENCLFEICVDNFYKGKAKPEDIFHRINMLSCCEVPVLITSARTYTEKDSLFRSYLEKDYVYRIGTDAWNRCIQSEGMFDGVSALFEVCHYPGQTVNAAPLNFKAVPIPRPNVRSSDIRFGRFNHVPEKVELYIKDHGLYQ